ncbi:MAG: alpha/beta hydrolase-fold protein, partial [Gammaproteobacteria bacterium]|nr:alpha/beta hydrolase-fold protein [Gammaproteobacteria bacterium]
MIDIDGRTTTVFEPQAYDPGIPAPVLLLLHGYTMSGIAQENMMDFTPVMDAEGFLFVRPDGLVDCEGDRFWNATAACCNFCGSSVDDSAYLQDLIEEIKFLYNVDERRVFVVGYSNGGFMAHRLACEHADTFAAIASLGGATFPTPAQCPASESIHVLEIHGTADATIEYIGGSILGNPYPGAVVTVETWAALNGCSLAADIAAANLNLVHGPGGAETEIARYETDCVEGGSAELWTMNNTVHFPILTNNFSQDVVDYLLDHPQPVPEPPEVLLLAAGVGFLAVL